MITVGITGGIGSGKTTFCKEWETQEDVFVLYADDFAKELMQTDPELIQQIKNTFGDESYDQEGNLNRPYLATEAFEKGRVEELNGLVHPVLWKRTEELIREKKKEGINVFAKEAAILLNDGRPENLDYVILLMADEDLRVERTLERDQSSHQKIEERMNKQPDFESLTHLADFVVMNDGSLKELKTKAFSILKKIKQID
ncbi:dephospho-CoA kinase [Gracilimonas mengyeensis]|uniref:Dephospho-CoA kinase n=1 Tax=Gracilimonas mengyeensis TaxID=1302730 RepID=A0A521AYQ7_9BACT|nr:dephospho-CoA kinase [Gracilimonas mengyeensis]SMO39963.1 dephospho-CoA kinase [Gracilimonas mengyeensis]